MGVLIVRYICWEKTINFDKIRTFDIKTNMQCGCKIKNEN